jgi:hypothetical protein
VDMLSRFGFPYTYILGTDGTENTASKNSSVVSWLFVPAETNLSCLCLAIGVFSRFAIQAFFCNVTIVFPLISDQLYNK